MAIARAELLRVGGENVVDWVVVGVTEVVVDALERAEWARNAARKLAKNGRLVGMMGFCDGWFGRMGSRGRGIGDSNGLLFHKHLAVVLRQSVEYYTCRCLA